MIESMNKDTSQPVAYYTASWTLTPASYRELCHKHPAMSLDFKPAYASVRPADLVGLEANEIGMIWRQLGGPEKWLQDFGYMQFAEAITQKLAEKNGFFDDEDVQTVRT